ncbi:MAG: OsmC family protein [Solirubrobacterales bacterium]
MKITATRREGFAHDVKIDGHDLVVDEPTSAGGMDLGPTPVQLLASALATCTAITVEMYAERKRWEIGSVTVDVDYESDGRGGAKEFMVNLGLAKGLSADQTARLLKIAGKCPVHRVMAANTEVEIVDTVTLV